MRTFALVLSVLVLAGCACGAETVTPPSEGAGPVPEPTPEPMPMGTVTGVVRLAEGADLPRYAASGLSVGGATPLPAECSAERAEDREPMRLAADRGVSNVPVIAMGDAARWPRPGAPSTVSVRIHDCRLDPWVVTATVGDVLRIENELLYPFFPSVAGLETGFNQAVLPGEARELELDVARPMTMECTVTTGCRRAELLVLGHPVHTVSGEAGRFTLSVPADQDVELVAWHPLVQEAAVRTRVAAGATVTVEIVVRPAPTPEPPPPSLPPGERPEDHPELGPF